MIVTMSYSQTQNLQKITVKSVNNTSWIVKQPYTVTTTNNHKVSGAVLGGLGGYLLTGKTKYAVGGALLGSQVGDKPTYTTQTYYKDIPMRGYLVLLSNGESYRTTTLYIVGQVVIPSTIKQE